MIKGDFALFNLNFKGYKILSCEKTYKLISWYNGICCNLCHENDLRGYKGTDSIWFVYDNKMYYVPNACCSVITAMESNDIKIYSQKAGEECDIFNS